MEVHSRYSRVVPNSQMFISLENIKYLGDLEADEFNKEFILIGLKNTREHGGVLLHEDREDLIAPYTFTSLNSIINYLEQKDWDGEHFLKCIRATLHHGWDIKLDINNKTKMTRKDVYSKIGDELDYQQLRWVVRRDANGTPDESKPPAEWLSYIRKHVRLADDAIYNLDDAEAMAQFRKIAGLAVRAMMIHGCPDRVIPEELLNENKG